MRGSRGAVVLAVTGLLVAACSAGEPESGTSAARSGAGASADSAPPADATGSTDSSASPAARSAAVRAAAPETVVAFSGDIAGGGPGSASYANASATGDLVRQVDPAYVLTGGDNAYPMGTRSDFRTKYTPTWGSFKAITRPAPGNHEYMTPGAAGYYGYFFDGVATGHRYYAFGAGAGWRVYALNCEVPCGTDSTQVAWLRRDLADHPDRHYLVTVHRPRYTSGKHLPYHGLNAIWRAVVNAGGDLVLSGHNHQYERFSKQDASGRWKPSSGLVQFVAGAGGAEMYPFSRTAPRSQARNARDFGVLVLQLRPGGYSWEYLGSGRCFRSGRSYDCPAHTGRVLDEGSRTTNNPG
ncbi:MAG: metallophosphoesterase family protein [Actinomycetes bacterium]